MKKSKFKRVIKIIVIFINLTGGNAGIEEEKARMVESALTSSKIQPNLKAKLMESNEVFDVYIEFSGGNQKALHEYRNDPICKTKDVKRSVKLAKLVEKLEKHAHSCQGDVIEFLQLKNVTCTKYWIDNHLHVKEADASLLGELAMKFGEIERIKQPVPIHRPRRIPASATVESSVENELPWPILQMRARCDEIDCLGEGVVVAITDPDGFMPTHEELRDNWREDHGWFDPLEGSLVPRAPGNHGTMCAGCAVGKTVGVAPKTQWIGCIISDDASVRACGQWLLCPTNPDGSDRNCSYAPHIVSNSWSGDREWETRLAIRDVISAWNEAGFFTVFSAGNSGPSCTTVEMPAYYDISFAIGAIDSVSAATWFSSRGPTLNKAHINPKSTTGTCTFEVQPDDLIQSRAYGEKNEAICVLTKPELSAPGLNINSSDTLSDTAYAVESGTSFATPFVAGVAALMVCANKQAGKQPLDWQAIGNILKETASTDRINLNNPNDSNAPTNLDRSSHILCDIYYGNCNSFPNNIYGWGEVDACKAVGMVKSIK